MSEGVGEEEGWRRRVPRMDGGVVLVVVDLRRMGFIIGVEGGAVAEAERVVIVVVVVVCSLVWSGGEVGRIAVAVAFAVGAVAAGRDEMERVVDGTVKASTGSGGTARLRAAADPTYLLLRSPRCW